MSKMTQDQFSGVASPAAGTSTTERAIVVRGNTIDSSDLFSGNREIVISHGSENYRLRLTSQNKLILTK